MEDIHGRENEVNPNNLRILPFEKILEKAKKDIPADVISTTDRRFGENSFENFIENHVHIIHKDGIDFTVIDQEWDFSSNNPYDQGTGDTYLIHPVVKAYIEAKRTKIAMVEYLDPELAQNAANTPLIGKKLSDMYNVGGDRNHKHTGRHHPRIEYFTQIGSIAKDARKPVAVADIANKMTYQAFKIATEDMANLGFFGTIAAATHTGLSETTLSLAAYTALTMPGAIMDHSGLGMFDKKQIHEFEKFMLNMEDARRLFVAKGGKQLMDEYSTKGRVDEEGNPLEDAQIVLVYPVAHARRIIDYMVNPDIIATRAREIKNLLYRIVPNMDISVRTWRWKDTMSKLSGDESFAHWEKSSDRKIEI